jgi:hypothetical protein
VAVVGALKQLEASSFSEEEPLLEAIMPRIEVDKQTGIERAIKR